MNLLEFTTSIIDSLAWPIVAIITIYWIKPYFNLLLPNIDRMQFKEFSIFFRNSMQRIEKESEAVLEIENNDEEISNNELKERLYRLGDISPRAAVIESWLNVENCAAIKLNLGQANDTSVSHTLSPLLLGKLIQEEKLINSVQFEVFKILRAIRNRAAHAASIDISSSELKEYIDLSLALAKAIQYSHQDSNENNNP